MQYRRANVGGGTYFFTVNLAERNRTLLVDHVNELREVVKDVKQRHPFRIDAVVVLPDHLHALWTLPRDEADFATRWMLIKAGFARGIARTERINTSRANKGERGIWQRRYWEHLIRDERDYGKHVAYIHYKPVKHGVAKRAADWPYSSIHGYVAAGTMRADWGGADDVDELGGLGER